MKNEIVNALTQATQALKDTVVQAVGEIKGRINEKLGILATIKEDLANAYDDLNEINGVVSDFANDMTDMCEETDNDICSLEDLLYNINPEYFEEDTEEIEETEVEEEEDFDTNESDFGVNEEEDTDTEETED